nr:unnamed protein product [Rangifer tarandus platyrhynchus]
MPAGPELSRQRKTEGDALLLVVLDCKVTGSGREEETHQLLVVLDCKVTGSRREEETHQLLVVLDCKVTRHSTHIPLGSTIHTAQVN